MFIPVVVTLIRIYVYWSCQGNVPSLQTKYHVKHIWISSASFVWLCPGVCVWGGNVLQMLDFWAIFSHVNHSFTSA